MKPNILKWTGRCGVTCGHPLATALIMYQLLCNATHAVDYSSNPLDIAQQEQLLRKFVNFVTSERRFCSSDAWIVATHRATAEDKITDDQAHSFQAVYNMIFSPDNLTMQFLADVQQAIRIARMVYRIQQTNPGFPSPILEQLLQSFLQSDSNVIFHKPLDHKYARNRTRVPQSDSALISIEACRGDKLLGYVSQADDAETEAMVRTSCSQTPAHFPSLPGDQASRSVRLLGDKHGQLEVYWLTDTCTIASPTQSTAAQIPIQLHVRPTVHSEKLRFTFELDMRNFTLNQCATNTHRCGATTKCVYHQYTEWPFAMDNYICKCTSSYYLDTADNGYPAPFIHAQLQIPSGDTVRRFHCNPCPPGCSQCGTDKTCRASLDLNLIRAIPLALQTFCCTICVVLAIALFRLRRTRVIRSANWVLMDILLIGAVLLYFIVMVMYFPPSVVTCLAIPWLRELGFSVMYGVLIVKIYRVLCGFQSRKAHRVHVRDKDILKFLGIFIITTFLYMVAWTAVNLDYISTSWNRHTGNSDIPVSIVGRGKFIVHRSGRSAVHETGYNTSLFPNTSAVTSSLMVSDVETTTVTFDVCRSRSWDIVVQLAEFMILAVSIHYCRLVRSAPSEYNETLYISIALIVELSISGIFNIVRHIVWYSLHPDYMFLIYFAWSHITVTVNLALIFGPKAWLLYRPNTGVGGVTRTRSTPVAPYTVDPNLASTGKLNLALNGDLDIADVNLADMDPEVIRRELKRLYTQIELYKTKAMRKDNPHISKRRGGRKQRRFSLQPFHKRHGHGQNISAGTPLMISTSAGYCWGECRSGRGAPCSKHVAHMNLCKTESAASAHGSRPGGYYSHSSVIHDEEASRLSEESTNSTEEFSPQSNVLEHTVTVVPASTSNVGKTARKVSLSAAQSSASAVKKDAVKVSPNSPHLRLD